MSEVKRIARKQNSKTKIILVQNSDGVFEISPENIQKLKIRLPAALANRYTVVGYQEPLSPQIIVGLSEKRVDLDLTSIKEVEKFRTARFVLKNAYDELDKQKKSLKFLSVLSHYEKEEVIKSLSEESKSKMLLFTRYLDRLSKNQSVLSENLCEDKLSVAIKELCLKAIKDIRNYIFEHLLSFLKSYDIGSIFKVDGIPEFLVKMFTLNLIQIKSKMENLRNMFFSKNNCGPLLSIKELVDTKTVNYLGEVISERTRCYGRLVDLLIKAEVKDRDLVDDLMNLKVNLIPVDSLSVFIAKLPSMKLMSKSHKVVNLITMLNWAFRLTYGDSMKDLIEIGELIEGSNNTKQVLLRKLFSSKLKKKEIVINDEKYYELVKKIMSSMFISYGIKKDDYLALLDKSRKERSKNLYVGKDFKFIGGKELQEKFDALRKDNVVNALFMKTKKEKVSTVRSVLSKDFKKEISNCVDDYPIFKGTKQRIATFLSGFENPKIRALALEEIRLSMENMTIEHVARTKVVGEVELGASVIVVPSDEDGDDDSQKGERIKASDEDDEEFGDDQVEKEVPEGLVLEN